MQELDWKVEGAEHISNFGNIRFLIRPYEDGYDCIATQHGRELPFGVIFSSSILLAKTTASLLAERHTHLNEAELTLSERIFEAALLAREARKHIINLEHDLLANPELRGALPRAIETVNRLGDQTFLLDDYVCRIDGMCTQTVFKNYTKELHSTSLASEIETLNTHMRLFWDRMGELRRGFKLSDYPNHELVEAQHVLTQFATTFSYYARFLQVGVGMANAAAASIADAPLGEAQ